MINGASVSWVSKKHTSIALFSTKPEAKQMSPTVRFQVALRLGNQPLHLGILLQKMKMHQVQCNNQGAIALTKNSQYCWMGGPGGCERTCSILRCAPLLTKQDEQTCVRNQWFTLNAVLCSPQHYQGGCPYPTTLNTPPMGATRIHAHTILPHTPPLGITLI